MPFPMRIQPVDFTSPEALHQPVKSVVKSRFKRFFERRNSAPVFIEEFDPSSVCLAKMVQNFIENDDSPESESQLFNWDSNHDLASDASDSLKSLIKCSSIPEKNLQMEISRILEKNKVCNKETVVHDLLALGYNASICKSRWEKSNSHPAGEYEYVDVILDNNRLIVDIDFRSQFEIARSTKTYKAVLELLPHIFVGKSDRLEKIIDLVSESSKQSLKKKGMPFPPWRKPEYLKAKWLSPKEIPCKIQCEIPGRPDRILNQKKSTNGVKTITGF